MWFFGELCGVTILVNSDRVHRLPVETQIVILIFLFECKLNKRDTTSLFVNFRAVGWCIFELWDRARLAASPCFQALC